MANPEHVEILKKEVVFGMIREGLRWAGRGKMNLYHAIL